MVQSLMDFESTACIFLRKYVEMVVTVANYQKLILIGNIGRDSIPIWFIEDLYFTVGVWSIDQADLDNREKE